MFTQHIIYFFQANKYMINMFTNIIFTSNINYKYNQ